MLCSYNWLKEYVKGLPEALSLADMLTMSGTEVESVAQTSSGVKGVVTAEVVSVGKHPNADRLSLCEVRTDREAYSIVCGAANMKAGDRVALALPGAELPNGLKIKKSKIRGVESGGMMCSEVELGLKETSEGIMILPKDTPLGVDLNAVLGTSDFMMEVGVTPNRADLLSVKGIAREAAAAVPGAVFADKEIHPEEALKAASGMVKVAIEATEACSRYMARLIEGVKVGPSPDYIVRRLEAHGLRPVNNIVDVTNYVLLETGQPLHAFDLDKIKGPEIKVRFAAENETVETIDGKVRKLESSMPVIADKDGPLAVAGVMGGKGSEIGSSTVNVLLECASFTPSYVRRAARKLGLSTDSSYRFERGVDINGVPKAVDMAAHLIKKLAGGEILKGALDVYPAPSKPAPIRLRVGRAGGVLGVRLNAADVKRILERLGMEVDGAGEGVLSVTPPSYRIDIKEEIDLIEETARLLGYDKVNATMPQARLSGAVLPREVLLKKTIAEALSGAGFFEVINYSFVSRGAIGAGVPSGRGEAVILLNPLSEEQSVMRTSLIPSLLETLKRNLLQKNERLDIFEIAPVFLPAPGEAKLPAERWRAAGLMYGARWEEAWNLPKDDLDFYDVKGAVERLLECIGIPCPVDAAPLDDNAFFHPGKAARVVLDGAVAGFFGEIHPDLKQRYDLNKSAFVFDLDVEVLLSKAGVAKKYQGLAKFPESSRDIAFIVGSDVRYQEIIGAIKRLDTKLIEKVELFDVYCGGNIPEGKISMALRLVYRSLERTLKHSEVDELHSRVAQELSGRFDAVIRGAAEGA